MMQQHQKQKPTAAESPFQSRSFFHSVAFALQGIRLGLKTQRNLRIHLIITIFVVVVGMVLGLAPASWAIIIICIGLMWLAELFNTAIEWLVDLYTQHQYDPLGGQIKDIAAGACLLMAMVSTLVGILIFLPYCIAYFSR